MEDRLLFRRGSFRFKLTSSASKEIIKIVSNTVWGSVGKMQWKMMNTSKFIPKIINPNWLTLYHGDKLLFTMVLSNRKVSSEGGLVDSYYIRYVTFNEKFRNKSNKSKISGIKRGTDRGFVRKGINEFVNASKNNELSKTIVYALVELNNAASIELCKNFGLETIRNCRTILFSRFFPKKNSKIIKLKEEDKPELINLLQKHYKGHNLFFTGNMFHSGTYYVIKRENNIIAGLQITPNIWKIDHLPGITGAIIVKVLSKLPLISRIVNPKEFRFALFDGVYVKKGHEADLISLMESVLADFKLNSAMLCLDHNSTLCNWLHKSGNLGLLNKLKGDSLAQLVARFDNFSEEEIQQFKNKPAFISAFDMA